MSDRDDMVIVIDLGHEKSAATRVAPARAESIAIRIGRAIKGNRFARKLANVGMISRMLSRGRAVMSPLTFLAAAAAAAVAAGVRLGTGRSFENIGQTINDALLGTADDAARARRNVRDGLISNRDFVRLIGEQGSLSSGVKNMIQRLIALEFEKERGRSIFMGSPAFQVNGLADFIVLRVRDAFTGHWHGSPGQMALDELKSLAIMRGHR